MWKKSFVVSISLVVGIGYLLHVPYPDACDYPFGVKIYYGFARLIHNMGRFLELFGCSYSAIYRWLDFDAGYTLEGVKYKTEELNGINVGFFEPTGHSKPGPRPAMVYFHGGGWTIGSIGTFRPFLTNMAKDLDMLVVVPEYRLAPEHPFPIPFQDCLDVVEEFMQRAEEFNVDARKIVLSGDSAGGNFAMTVSLALHARQNVTNLPNICMANMINPILQMSNLRLPSYQMNPNPPLLPPSQILRFLLSYMGLEKRTELIEPMLSNAHMEDFDDKEILKRVSEDWIPEKYKKRGYSSTSKIQYSSEQKISLQMYRKMIQELSVNPNFNPLTVDDEEIRKMPISNILTCEYDVLRDDGIILYERMKSLGMKVTHQHWEFGSHGLSNLYGLFAYDKLEKGMQDMFDVIRDVVEKC